MKIIIPDNNDSKLLDAVKRLTEKKSNHQIAEIYGKPTKSKHIGSGRANIFFDPLSKDEMIKRVEAFKKMGVDYEYSLNDIVPRARVLENRDEIIKELKWLEESPIKAASFANYEMIKLAEKYCPNVNAVVSFYCNVDNVKKIRQFAKLKNVKVINTGVKTFRNIPLLKQLADEAKKHDIKIRVIANLGCMADCIRAEEHAIMKSFASIDTSVLHYAPCTFYCMKYHYENPEKFLRLPIIRPEDLRAYETISIDSVKLVDRIQKTPWIEKVVGHYLDGFYKGNILDFTCTYTTLSIKKMSNKEVAEINMKEIIKSREGVLQYREILPELMDVRIEKDYNLLGCNNDCGNCGGCKDISAVKYNPERRKIVLKQLEKLEKEYLFI
ncbi:MAG: hypothetical protein ABIC82_04450 [bacterium]